MQLLSSTTSSSTNGISHCARELLDTAPTLIEYIRHHMRRHRRGLSVPQFRALYKVCAQPAANLSVVAEHLSASLPTTSRIVTTLVVKGYLRRSGSTGDRRQVALHITARGRAILDAAQAATQAQMESRLRHLSREDRSAIGRAMRVLRSLLESEMPPGRQRSEGVSIDVPVRGKGGGKRSVASVTMASAERD